MLAYQRVVSLPNEPINILFDGSIDIDIDRVTLPNRELEDQLHSSEWNDARSLCWLGWSVQRKGDTGYIWDIQQLWPFTSYNRLFLWDCTFYEWGYKKVNFVFVNNSVSGHDCKLFPDRMMISLNGVSGFHWVQETGGWKAHRAHEHRKAPRGWWVNHTFIRSFMFDFS